MNTVRAVTVTPGVPHSLQLADDWPEPAPEEGAILVQALAVGICGTDYEIISGAYGEAPPGQQRLVLGHESLGRVLEDPTGTLQPGDLVAGIVRHPDPVPCPNCAVGEWDMCRNGQYTEHGIKGLPGFARDRWRVQPKFAVGLDPVLAPVGMLLEPTSVVAKAWDHIERIGSRAEWKPQSVLVTGAGPIGLLAALLATQRELSVHVLDRNATGPKPELVRSLGATYHTTPVGELDFEPDVVVECTGAPSVVMDAMCKVGPTGIVCLTGVSSGGRTIDFDAGALNRALVLENNVVFGSVNANRRHWDLAAAALARADQAWLNSLITRRVPVSEYADAYTSGGEDIKVVLDFAQ
ncbi:glucose 1-dehydrogenase [Micromonospora sp. PPF5-17]|uniref:Theronine dehydrogenase n=1 Tax=Micromonospora solifontis TaxID=2487138 RepID=A0ABX9WAS5_9ACTN|nr:glucose 1-dehydrogenase [Micromonospora sp. PPF5-17B]NES39181.1 glucose 1-dehydrogenase [Micromonospora solifontis]NES54559.1 glucose 1-dehydrogenase [Micromonospora sp. PPF5-6]RNL90368.1 theronine dehydrogenase [Micromonospora solifontis]